MPDIFDIIKNWWKQILGVMLVSVLTIGIIVFLKPKLYLSVATAVPASAYASDKGAVFNENLQALYNTLGTTDDLDLVLGTAELDTVYLAVASSNDLVNHYKIDNQDPDRMKKAADCLRKKSRVMKSGYGELKVRVWDGDKQVASRLANAIMETLEEMHRNLRSVSNQMTLDGLIAGKNKILHGIDSATITHPERIAEYDKLIAEYQLMVDSKPAVLITVEKARPALYPDKPRKKQILAATTLLSFLFAFFAALILERRKMSLA